MNPSTIPVTCGLAITAVLAAGISHWWSVRQFSDLIEQGVPLTPAPVSAPEHEPQPQHQHQPAVLASNDDLKAVPSQFANKQDAIASTTAEMASNQGQNEFFEALVDKMNRVEAQNRDLLDQLAETNRDMMRMQFRLDTHSESFRPLPVVEDKPFSSIEQGNIIDYGPGVLPPKAEPIGLPSYE